MSRWRCAWRCLISGKLAKDDAEARAKLQAVLDNGKAAEVFWSYGSGTKGRTDFVENYAEVSADSDADESSLC